MNRLAAETSPYLLQHAENPVDWYPWGAEALERARDEDRPILLSVGYSACHWCHVMAHESFESAATAAVMNEHFVNVKVDREERPDVDALYMDATVSMTGQGGWPMTVFLTPAGEPFYAGTYFPPEPRHGMPSFTQLLLAVAEAWRAQRDDLVAQAKRLVEAVGHSARIEPSSEPLTAALLDGAEHGIARTFDRTNGGFGRAPKFPPASTLEFLLRRDSPRGARDGHEDARRDGRGRDVRPRRRRLPPLLGRRALARAALREDALRQRAARARVPPRLGRDRRGSLPHGRRGDARLHDPRAAACPTVGSRRRRTPTRTASRGSRSRGRRRRACPPSCCCRSSTAARSSAASFPPTFVPGSTRSGICDRSPASTTRCSPPGTGSRSRRSRRVRAGSSAPTGSTRRVASGSSSSGRCRGRTAGCPARGGRAR